MTNSKIADCLDGEVPMRKVSHGLSEEPSSVSQARLAAPAESPNRSSNEPVFKFRLVASIVRSSGLGYATCVFAVLFAACSVFIALFEPGINHPFDAVWFCFQAVTTIGFGDVEVATLPCRIATMVLSAFAVLYIAVLTGAVVSYCTERIKMRHDESLAHFMDKLENLPELSQEELAELSQKVRERR